jgi:hypothetical protein
LILLIAILALYKGVAGANIYTFFKKDYGKFKCIFLQLKYIIDLLIIFIIVLNEK